ncbi:MAG TPA: hypothetical protein VGD46_13430 [Rhizobacter sp.]
MKPKQQTASLDKIAFGMEAAEFMHKLDALMAEHGARLVMQRTFGEHALQIRFQGHAATALTIATARPGKGSVVYAGDWSSGSVDQG